MRGYTRHDIHVVLDDDDMSDDELPATVKYATIVQEEPFIDDDLFSHPIVQ